MDQKEREIHRGARAKEIAADPIFTEAAAHIDAELWRLFRECAVTDTAAMTEIKAMQYFHQKYQAFITRCIQDGKLARMEIEQQPRHTAKEFGY